MRFLLTVTLIATYAAACSSSGAPNTTGNAGSGGNTSAAGQTGAAGNGTAGTGTAGTGTAGTGTGTAGNVGGAGNTSAAGTTGTAGAGTAGTTTTNPDASTMPDGGAGDFPTASCSPGAIFCDDFEEYDPKMTGFLCPANPPTLCDFIPTGSTTPTWLAYHFHGPPTVDTSKPFKGKQQYHWNTETGHIAAEDLIKESPDGMDLWPAAHYGRVMYQIKQVPPKGPFAIFSESGLLAGGVNEAQYTLGSVGGQLAWIYTQRKRPLKNDVSKPTMRLGGNWQVVADMPTTMCTAAATTVPVPAGKYVCIEWMIDRTKPELQVWLDGVAQPQLDVSGAAGTCSAGTAAMWTGPEHFTELDLGFEMWGTDGGPAAWEGWYDEFAVGTQRLGCPTP